MNWRVLVGLVFLIVGVGELYSVMEKNAAVKLNVSPIYAELGCAIWIAVGVFMVIQGMKKIEK